MKIYHYTSISTLALILQNRTIKFSRLDSMDDLEEIGYTPEGIKLGQYMLVSCWTDSSEEDISQWSMYGEKGRGVRIEMDSDMFVTYSPESNSGIEILNTGKKNNLIIPLNKVMHPDYLLVPISRNLELDDDSIFFRKIKYVDEVNTETKEAYTSNKDKYNIKFIKIGKFKHKRWEFQQEVRFSIIAIPHGVNINSEIDEITQNKIEGNIPPSINEYFAHLKDDAIKNMTIRLGPSCTDSSVAIVKSLLNNFIGDTHNKIEYSSLSGIIRIK